jgi:hypothetical protein
VTHLHRSGLSNVHDAVLLKRYGKGNHMKEKTRASDEKRLRALGWMTTDEFLEKLGVGLECYIKENTYLGSNETALHHPEDLILNIQTYMEVAYHVLASFAPAPDKKVK